MDNKTNLTILTVVNKSRRDDGLRLLERESKKLKFLNPKTLLVDDCSSYLEYNRRSVMELSDYFDTDFCLIVQFDGKVINPNAWTDNFLKYDYIGAPWAFFGMLRYHQKENPTNKDYLVGNGGFCLRSKKLYSALKEIANDYTDENEDVYICQKKRDVLEKMGIKFAPFDVAKKFSVENQIYNGQFGAHKEIFSYQNGIFKRHSIEEL